MPVTKMPDAKAPRRADQDDDAQSVASTRHSSKACAESEGSQAGAADGWTQRWPWTQTADAETQTEESALQAAAKPAAEPHAAEPQPDEWTAVAKPRREHKAQPKAEPKVDSLKLMTWKGKVEVEERDVAEFRACARLVGPGGANMKKITDAGTDVKAHLIGKGSQSNYSNTGPLQLLVSAPHAELKKATAVATGLLQRVQQEYEAFKKAKSLTRQLDVGMDDHWSFQVCKELIGPVGSNMQRITAAGTNVKAFLSGKGSQNRASNTGPLQLIVSADDTESLGKAVEVATELIQKVQKQYKAFWGL